ncbi:hypothetical protein RND71_000191 [Anisodus tanguticus]|uniref:Uncharacterized protein n=1 Tax=Anisodus tanguticus TaxID=243964 RepID=A0AAE1SWW3_9SOLA|nr:hypothetical protein RND71_000191 [Anisodus tanguticus]
MQVAEVERSRCELRRGGFRSVCRRELRRVKREERIIVLNMVGRPLFAGKVSTTSVAADDAVAIGDLKKNSFEERRERSRRELQRAKRRERESSCSTWWNDVRQKKFLLTTS